MLRVGLATDQPRVRLSCFGEALLTTDAGATRLARLAPGSTVEIVPDGRRVRWAAGGQAGSAVALLLQPIDPQHFARWGDEPYRGELLVAPGARGLLVVNLVELESYLRGVVPWEIGRPGPAGRAALEAQAVAARTYTVSHRDSRRLLGFDVWADTRDQVYRGAAAEDSLCNAAIVSTAGLVLRQAGREIEAYYSACCGGHTSAVHEVWPREPRGYLIAHPDTPPRGGAPFCGDSASFSWEAAWSADALSTLLARTLPEYLDYVSGADGDWARGAFRPRRDGADARRPGRLLGLRVAERTSCGRIARLEVATEAGVYQVRGDRVRWVFPPAGGKPAILRSALCDFAVTTGRDGAPVRVVATGRGFGHGVGLCQDGAVAMARRGYDCAQILAHYYPGAMLASLDSGAGSGSRAQ